MGLLTLKVDSPLASPDAPNYYLPRWPPPPDFPITIDRRGDVVSRYADELWDLSPYANRTLRINFGPCVARGRVSRIDGRNADLYRQMVAWRMFGICQRRSAGSIYTSSAKLRCLFASCSDAGIAASDLHRFPAVLDDILRSLRPNHADALLTELHEAFQSRDVLGFYILDEDGLRRLRALRLEHVRRQTAYVPPRIWLYQLGRLGHFLDDFQRHQTEVTELFKFCLDAYCDNHKKQFTAANGARNPFAAKALQKKDARYHGRFDLVAKRFGVAHLLGRWCLPKGRELGRGDDIGLLSKYLSQVGFVGLAYIMNYSGMRSEEARSLHTGCLSSELDPRLGRVFLLRGRTTKTLDDDDAAWISSSAVHAAVDSMTVVAGLRLLARDASTPRSQLTLEPHLVEWAHEPWAPSPSRERSDTRPAAMAYGSWPRIAPNLFDPSELTITAEDLQFARKLTPTLSPERFAVGHVWPLAWHQLRRTLAVNMAASGLVSDFSLQYQLKHLSRAMSLYYGRGYSQLRVDEAMRTEYIRAVYEQLGMQFEELLRPRYVSPYGEEHKANVLSLISSADHKRLVTSARNGAVSYRATLLGACVSRVDCPYGGIDNVVRCGGNRSFRPCPNALFDKSRQSAIRELRDTIDLRLMDAPDDSPYRASLIAQRESVENVLNVLDAP